jgi:hypothetical protein
MKMKLSNTTVSRRQILHRIHVGSSLNNYKIVDDFMQKKGIRTILDKAKNPHYSRNEALACQKELLEELKKNSKRPQAVGIPKPKGLTRRRAGASKTFQANGHAPQFPFAPTIKAPATTKKATKARKPAKVAKESPRRRVVRNSAGQMFTVRVQYARNKHITLSMDESKKLHECLQKLWGDA